MSVKFQITLPDDMALDVKRAATRNKMPLARFIRETIAARLRRPDLTQGGDPFASITGLVDAPDTDLAERIDEILYQRTH